MTGLIRGMFSDFMYAVTPSKGFAFRASKNREVIGAFVKLRNWRMPVNYMTFSHPEHDSQQQPLVSLA
jgi:hypothetical protein